MHHCLGLFEALSQLILRNGVVEGAYPTLCLKGEEGPATLQGRMAPRIMAVCAVTDDSEMMKTQFAPKGNGNERIKELRNC